MRFITHCNGNVSGLITGASCLDKNQYYEVTFNTSILLAEAHKVKALTKPGFFSGLRDRLTGREGSAVAQTDPSATVTHVSG